LMSARTCAGLRGELPEYPAIGDIIRSSPTVNSFR
jgi:hypothetical protein